MCSTRLWEPRPSEFHRLISKALRASPFSFQIPCKLRHCKRHRFPFAYLQYMRPPLVSVSQRLWEPHYSQTLPFCDPQTRYRGWGTSPLPFYRSVFYSSHRLFSRQTNKPTSPTCSLSYSYVHSTETCHEQSHGPGYSYVHTTPISHSSHSNSFSSHSSHRKYSLPCFKLILECEPRYSHPHPRHFGCSFTHPQYIRPLLVSVSERLWEPRHSFYRSAFYRFPDARFHSFFTSLP